MKVRNPIIKINQSKYLVPPSWEQIQSLLDELGVSQNHYEKFFSLPYNTLTQVKSGARPLPTAYWGLVYEKVKPTYGAGFLHEYTQKATKKIDRPKPKKKKEIQPLMHSRLSAIK